MKRNVNTSDGRRRSPTTSGPYAVEVNNKGRDRKPQGNSFLRQLHDAAVKDFDTIKFVRSYPAGTVLFIERQAPQGVYVLCEGQVKLSMSSCEGKTVILRIAKVGDVLGLVSVLSGNLHELTAETVWPSKFAFVPCKAFLRFLSRNPEAYEAVVDQVASHYQVACEQLRSLGLSASAPSRLAKLLLDFSTFRWHANNCVRIQPPWTHEQIAQFIGTTRETVTRILSEFKSRHLIEIRGSTLVIKDPKTLEKFAED